MDPISIIGLVGSSLTGIIKAKEWIDGIQRAPRLIQALSRDLHAIEMLLGHLDCVLKSADNETQNHASRQIRHAVDNCEDTARQIDKMLRPFVNSGGGDENINTWKRVTFNFRESDVLRLQRDMETCKQTLDLAIGCATFFEVQRLSRDMIRGHRRLGIAPPSVAGSSIAEKARLATLWRRFLVRCRIARYRLAPYRQGG
ncbi:hypothetical protein BR93DRAFT_965464 [Coniochaeta sp. PMI_546]|nr:hypothetical protein BR93DRAFT_965464 [Coniochaeta sp. PMI_546]